MATTTIAASIWCWMVEARNNPKTLVGTCPAPAFIRHGPPKQEIAAGAFTCGTVGGWTCSNETSNCVRANTVVPSEDSARPSIITLRGKLSMMMTEGLV